MPDAKRLRPILSQLCVPLAERYSSVSSSFSVAAWYPIYPKKPSVASINPYAMFVSIFSPSAGITQIRSMGRCPEATSQHYAPQSVVDEFDYSTFHSSGAKNGYPQSCGVSKVCLTLRGLIQRSRLSGPPALSLVPEALAPPNGCCATTAPVGLSLM